MSDLQKDAVNPDLESGVSDAGRSVSVAEVELDAGDPSTRAADAKGSSTSEPPFPTAFYCPLSKKILEDPVVTPEGVTYNRESVRGHYVDDCRLYDNRAIKSIVEEAVQYKNSSGLTKLQRNVRQLSQQLLNDFHRPLPDGYYCPITLGLIHDPVIDPEGYSYEKVAIESWIRVNGASPVTRREMALEDLYPNKTLTVLMDEEKAKKGDQLHPSFKQLKEEPAPAAPDIEIVRRPISTIQQFPTTPEQLDEANRMRRARFHRRCFLWAIVSILLGTLAWKVPTAATVLLVIILAGVALVAGFSSNSSTQFRGI